MLGKFTTGTELKFKELQVLNLNVFELFRSLLQEQFDLLPLIIHFRIRREPRFSCRFSTVTTCIFSLKATTFRFFVVHQTPACCLTPYKRISNNLLWFIPFFSLIFLLFLSLLSIHKKSKKASRRMSLCYTYFHAGIFIITGHWKLKASACWSRILSSLIMTTSIKIEIGP